MGGRTRAPRHWAHSPAGRQRFEHVREEILVMRKHWVLVGILVAALAPAPAFAQHKAPNQQPATDAAPAAPTGQLVLGTVRLTKATTADGKPLPAGTYT